MRKLGNQTRKRPYLEYFYYKFLGESPILFVLGMLLAGFINALVYFLSKGDQVAATIFAGLIAFVGAMITSTVQSRLTIYKSQLDQRRDGTNKVAPYYEGVIKLLKDPDSYSSKEISNFIDKFDNKLEIYGSETVVYQWKSLGLKERLLVIQAKPLDRSKDWDDFRNFIRTIRREMGHTGGPDSTSWILRDLMPEEDFKEDIQAAWVRWLDEVEQLKPEPPRSELDEYGKALLDKYKRQGLDL